MRFSILLASLAALVTAEPLRLPASLGSLDPPIREIKWQACRPGSKLQCGTFEVPLDYANATAGKALLAVARYPATSSSKIGTLFLNPGGPGSSGVDMILKPDTKDIMDIVGGKYDLVSWDPRGVGSRIARGPNIGQTEPRADCFNTGSEENDFWKNTIPRTGLEAHSNFTTAADLRAFYAQVPEVDTLLQKLGDKCLNYTPNAFQYVGTTATVRDMVALHDSLEGPRKPLNFWGFSYGTVVGIYFVNMFPDRVGQVVLDGVVDPVYWANRPAHEIWSISAESTDEALAGFVAACANAGPGQCRFTSRGATAQNLTDKVNTLLDLAYKYKKIYGNEAQFGSALIRDELYKGMYRPLDWPELARELQDCWTFLTDPNPKKKRCFRPLDDFQAHELAPSDRDPPRIYSLQAITCADAVDRGNITTKMVFDELVNVTRTVSQMFGPRWGIGGLYCHRWPVRAVERYTGPWNKTLSNKIVVIGNEADPITPLQSARSVAHALGDSAVLVEQKDWGHTSLSMHSTCTLDILKSYFVKNRHPPGGKVCGTDKPVFPGVTTSILSSLLANIRFNSVPNPFKDEKITASIRSYPDLLSAIVFAFSCAVILLLARTIASWVIRRTGKNSEHRGCTHEALDQVQGRVHVMEQGEKKFPPPS